MKAATLLVLLLCTHCCFADDSTNVLFASDWSEPVYSPNHHAIRGRLLIMEGSEPAYGGPKTTNAAMMFVELQNAQGACCGSVKLYFDVMGLKCALTNVNGVAVPLSGPIAYSGRGSLPPSWLMLPYNSTARLFVNPGSKSPLTIHKDGTPWSYWSISSSDTNVYCLSGSLTISTPTNATFTATPHESMSIHEYAEWTGTLVFPKIKISANEVTKQK